MIRQIVCDEAFTDAGKHLILQTVDIFQNFEIAKDAEDWKWMKIDGRVFGSDYDTYNFYMHPRKTGLSVQLCSKNDVSQSCYMFGIEFYEENDKKIAHVYHHGHGPFKIFGFKYEI